jgi:hypothetical protein
MKQWSIGLMSNDEKRNILDQHKTLYDGYRTMQPQVSNTQPLYTQDFANDKGGVTVNNKGEVKTYMNFGINEQVEKESMCSECGGMVYEGECMECGYSGGEMGEETQQVKNLKNVEDLNLSDKFDYTEEELDELSHHELGKGKKYKFKHPADSDEIEYEDEYQSPGEEDKLYKFKGKQTHILPKRGVEYFIDYLDEDDTLDADALQNLTGQEAPHMSDDMAPDGMDDDSDNDRKMMADGEMYETNQGNPYDNKERAYTFTSKGPKDSGDAYSIKADDMDLDDEEVQKPFDFASNGAMREFDQMESAWDDDDDLAILDYNQDDDYDDNDSWEEITSDEDSLDIDDDIRESFLKQKDRIVEMLNRMKSFN